MVAALHSANGLVSETTALTDSQPLRHAEGVQSADSGEPFGDLLKGAVEQVNRLDMQADSAVTGLMKGTGVDVHQAMIASEKASMAFEMVLAVRNKAVQSYQSVMSMQF